MTFSNLRRVLSPSVIIYNQEYNESETDLLTFKFRSIMVTTVPPTRRFHSSIMNIYKPISASPLQFLDHYKCRND